MIEQIGNDLYVVVQFTGSQAGVTGLTPTMDIWRVDSSGHTSILSGQAMTEIAKGCYRYKLPLANVSVFGLYLFIASTSSGAVNLKDVVQSWYVGPTWVGRIDATVSSRQQAGTTVQYLGPVAPNGDATIVRGDDYFASQSRALRWNVTGQPDLTGYTSVTLTARSTDGAETVVLTKAGTMFQVGVGTQIPQVELANTDTTSLTPGRYKFDVQVVLASKNITVVRGAFIVLEDQTHA